MSEPVKYVVIYTTFDGLHVAAHTEEEMKVALEDGSYDEIDLDCGPQKFDPMAANNGLIIKGHFAYPSVILPDPEEEKQ